MKKLLLLAALLTLPACVAPPVITMASLALSGVSYVQTGKTLPDHALSSVSQRDCIMFRAAKGEQVCQIDHGDVAAKEGADTEIALAGTPISGVETVAEAISPTGAVAIVPADPVGPVTVAALAPPTVQELAVEPPEAFAPDRRAASDAMRSSLGSVAPTSTVSDALFAAMPWDAVPRAVAASGPAAGKSSIATTALRSQPAAGPRRAASPSVDRTLHLVVGSFRDRERAVVHIANLTNEDLRIVETTVKDRVQYRVVAGPFASGDIKAARAAFSAQGVKGIWALRLPADTQIQVASR
ncbi:MAG: SPOR domain-containing protein [Alphaproteobacteria bacterium]